MTGDLGTGRDCYNESRKKEAIILVFLWEVPLMDVLQMLRRHVSPPCSDCLYHLGVVRCVVSPCPMCRMTGCRPSFCEPQVLGGRLESDDDGGKRAKCMR